MTVKSLNVLSFVHNFTKLGSYSIYISIECLCPPKICMLNYKR